MAIQELMAGLTAALVAHRMDNASDLGSTNASFRSIAATKIQWVEGYHPYFLTSDFARGGDMMIGDERRYTRLYCRWCAMG